MRRGKHYNKVKSIAFSPQRVEDAAWSLSKYVEAVSMSSTLNCTKALGLQRKSRSPMLCKESECLGLGGGTALNLW